VDSHDDQGLVACGGTLEPDTLIAAYRSGIFPWSSDPVISWWSPDPRAIFDLDSWRPHRSAARSVRRAGWRFTVDRDFAGVMRACAQPSADRPSTWITSDFEKSYAELQNNWYTFLVHPDANKTQIKIAIEQIFEVRVLTVNTINREGKRKRTRSGWGKRKDTKRAMVKLADGDRIEAFGGPVS